MKLVDSVSRFKDMKYDKQDHQGKAAFNERRPYAIQQNKTLTGGKEPKKLSNKNRTERNAEHGHVNHLL
jgi:hypothetical protein